MAAVNYRLLTKVKGEWVSVTDVEAHSHEEALREAVHYLKPEHDNKPIRFEQVTDAN